MLSSIIPKLIFGIVVIALVDLVWINWWIVKNQKSAENIAAEDRVVTQIVASPSPVDLTSPSPAAVATSTPTTIIEKQTVVEKESQTIVQTAQKEIFIPVGSGSTFSNSYVDLAGLEVTIDTSKYSEIDYVMYEGSLRLQDGNGKMYTRLYEKNVGGVVGSEMTSISPVSKYNASGRFSLPSGSHTFTIQAKTDLTSYAAHVENARIKIVLK